ncbi:MAG: hypothetical protein FWC64_03075 [Treponema sp.]|nr:hypothetical protein [Treponema sp.]
MMETRISVIKGLSLAALLFLVLSFCALVPAQAQPLPVRDSAVAEQYARWALAAIERGQWAQALAGLERAAGFADVSSDISYLLALARTNQNQSRRSVLQALTQALYVNRWSLFNSEAARFLKAETLIAVRAYEDALVELSRVAPGPREATLRLRALAAFRPWEFFSQMAHILDLYPRETEPVRVLFTFLSGEYRAGRMPGGGEREIVELALRRLPVLLPYDGELAWMAAPFMWDGAEARRLVLAYRAIHNPVPESLPAALRLEVIDEETAIEELFADSVLDRALLDEVGELLQSDHALFLLRRNLSAFTGVIIQDANGDGVPETFAEYTGGMLTWFAYDAAQDGVPGLTVYFEAGEPRLARTLLPPEGSNQAGRTAAILWERFPAVREAELDGVRYIPRPFEFHYSPFVFDNLWDSGLLFPVPDPLTAPLTRRILVFSALRVQRPSLEFSGGIEVVELSQGIPVRAREYVGGLVVAETEFLQGRPRLQRVDLTLSGRMDTVRFFNQAQRPVEIEDLWDYYRGIEYTVFGVEVLHE